MRPAPTVQQLHEALLGSPSATEVLARLFGGPVRARRLPCDPLALSPLQHFYLHPTPGEPACHRRVILLAAGRAVSEADLWYVPARLAPGMAALLRDTETPFGEVVRPIKPTRHTLAARICDPGEPHALEHQAVLRRADGAAIALVAERYPAGLCGCA
jgi:chorismate-pyruvate lyase